MRTFILYMQILVTSISVRINNCKNRQPIYLQCIYIQRKYSYKKPQVHRFLEKHQFEPVCGSAQFPSPSSKETLRKKGVYICAYFTLFSKNSSFSI